MDLDRNLKLTMNFTGIVCLPMEFVTNTMCHQSLQYQGMIIQKQRYFYSLFFFISRILRNKIGSLPHLPTHFPNKQASLPTPPPSSSSSAAMAYNSIYQVPYLFLVHFVVLFLARLFCPNDPPCSVRAMPPDNFARLTF